MGKLISTYDNLENIILSVCYGGLLSNFVDKKINVFGFNGLVDAKIGAFTSAIHALILNDNYDMDIHRDISNNLQGRVKALESGADPIYLAKFRKSYIVVNSVFGITTVK